MLEKQVEEKVCRYARNRGFLTYKFTSPARASVPDRLFISDEGTMWFIEFKRPGGKTTPGQDREIARLREQGVGVWVIDDPDVGIHLIDMVNLGIDPRVVM